MLRMVMLVAVSTIISAALAAASPARAAAPVHEWVSLDESFTHDSCGFTVEETFAGRLHFISWFDDAGTRTRQLVAAPNFRVTWRNTVTGESVTSQSPYVAHKEDNPDGSLTVAFTGLVGAITGGGRAYVTSGRFVVEFSEAGSEVISAAGPSGDLCEALIATIG
jgi:hypothetical protein